MTMPLDEKGRLARNGMPCCKDIPNSGKAETDDACSLCSTAPAPDELEVVAYAEILAGQVTAVRLDKGRHCIHGVVLADQAHSTIAALRAELYLLRNERDNFSDNLNEAITRGQAAEAEVKRLTEEKEKADNDLVDKYRDPKSGRFNFPGDVAAIVRRLEAAEAERDALRKTLDEFGSSRVRDRVAKAVGCNHDLLHDALQAEVRAARKAMEGGE